MANLPHTKALNTFQNKSRSRISGESALGREFKNADPSSLGVAVSLNSTHRRVLISGVTNPNQNIFWFGLVTLNKEPLFNKRYCKQSLRIYPCSSIQLRNIDRQSREYSTIEPSFPLRPTTSLLRSSKFRSVPLDRNIRRSWCRMPNLGPLRCLPRASRETYKYSQNNFELSKAESI